MRTPHNPVHIGNVIRNAIVFNLRNSAQTPVNVDRLLDLVANLFTLLQERQTNYLLVGGVALLQYIEGRNTEDIDLIMALSDLEILPEIQILDQNANFVRGRFNELQIDVLLTQNRLFDTIRQNYATIQPFLEQEIPCATVEGLLILKLYALPSLYRQGNFVRVGLYENDIATLLYSYRPPLKPLFDELAPHLSQTDLASLNDIVCEMQQRLDRFGQEFRE